MQFPGDVFTRLALHRVSMDSLLGRHWFGAAAYKSRKVLRQPAQLSQDHGASGQDPILLQKTPSAEGLAGWLAAIALNNQSASSRGQVLGYGGGEQGPLRPVFVQHDRSRPDVTVSRSLFMTSARCHCYCMLLLKVL